LFLQIDEKNKHMLFAYDFVMNLTDIILQSTQTNTRTYAQQTHIFPLFYEAEIASIRRLFVLLFLLEYIIPGDGCTTYVSVKLNSSFFVVLS